jgi:hypothetical protein
MLYETSKWQGEWTLARITCDSQPLELGEQGIEGFLEVLPRMIREANQGCQATLPIRRRPPLRRKNRPP